MHELQTLLNIARRKTRIDATNDWSDGATTYLSEIKKEADEVLEELPANRACYLEDELGDLLWDYLNILTSLEAEQGIDVQKVFQRAAQKYEERIAGIESGELWKDIKRRQKLRLAEEQLVAEEVIIREEIESDSGAVAILIQEAFKDEPYSQQNEHLIVAGLRDAGQMTVALVAEQNGKVIGHVAISPVVISDGSQNWFGLAPLAVSPECQGKGVGSALANRALSLLQDKGAAGCVLLGEPEYYSRFGFRACSGLELPGVPQEYFQARVFSGDLPQGEVSYHEAFNC